MPHTAISQRLEHATRILHQVAAKIHPASIIAEYCVVFAIPRQDTDIEDVTGMMLMDILTLLHFVRHPENFYQVDSTDLRTSTLPQAPLEQVARHLLTNTEAQKDVVYNACYSYDEALMNGTWRE